MRADGKSTSSPDDFVDALKIAGFDFFPNVRKLLSIGVVSPFSVSEVQKIKIRRLKTAFRSVMKDERESDLNLIQMHITGSINVEEIVQMFIRKKPTKIALVIIGF